MHIGNSRQVNCHLKSFTRACCSCVGHVQEGAPTLCTLEVQARDCARRPPCCHSADSEDAPHHQCENKYEINSSKNLLKLNKSINRTDTSKPL